MPTMPSHEADFDSAPPLDKQSNQSPRKTRKIRARFAGCYSRELSDHPAWNVIGPILEESKFLCERTKEADHRSDFTFALISKVCHVKLDVFLISPSCLEPRKWEDIAAMIYQFMVSNPASWEAIAILFTEDPEEHYKDQACFEGVLENLHECLELYLLLAGSLPIFPIWKPSRFESYIKRYMMKMLKRKSRLQCTNSLTTVPRRAGAKLPESQPNGILKVLFPTMQSLEQAVCRPEGVELLEAYLGAEASGKIARYLLDK